MSAKIDCVPFYIYDMINNSLDRTDTEHNPLPLIFHQNNFPWKLRTIKIMFFDTAHISQYNNN